MKRRSFFAWVGAFISWLLFRTADASAKEPFRDLLHDVPRNGHMTARFFRAPDGNKPWPEVRPEDIREGDTIIAIGVSDKGLWMILRSVVTKFYLDPVDGIWSSHFLDGTRLNVLNLEDRKDVAKV